MDKYPAIGFGPSLSIPTIVDINSRPCLLWYPSGKQPPNPMPELEMCCSMIIKLKLELQNLRPASLNGNMWWIGILYKELES